MIRNSIYNIIVFLTILGVCGCSAPIYVETELNESYYEADKFARAFGLRELYSTGSEELRIWAQENVFGDIFGLVVTPYESERCETTIEQDSPQVYRIARGQCRAYEVLVSQDDFNEIIGSLAALEGQNIACTNVMDGSGGIVEGIYGGKRFAFTYMKPDACDNPKAKKVSELLGRVGW